MPQAFFQKIKRFFAPVRNNYWYLIKPTLKSVWESAYVIFSIEIFRRAAECIQNNTYNDLQFLTCLYIAITVVVSIVNYLIKHVGWATMVYEWRKFFQDDVMNEFFQFDNTEVERIGTGKLIEILWKGYAVWNSLYQELAERIPSFLIISTYSLFQISHINSYYTAMVCLLVIAIVWFVSRINVFAIKHRNVRSSLEAESTRQFVKMIMSKMEIVQNNKMSTEISKAKDILSKSTTANLRLNFYLWGMFEPTMWLSYILRFAILVFGGYMLLHGVVDFALFVGLVAVMSVFEKTTIDFVKFYKDFTNTFANVQRLWDMLDSTKRMQVNTNDRSFIYQAGNISIQNLSFGYHKNHFVFDDFSTEITGGKMTAFVGVSGSGKTTLMKLIAGYIHPDAWSVCIDNQNLSEINIKEYYRHIGYLTQDPSVFDGTIYENLTYALRDAPSQSEIDTVIRDSKCEFILEFEHGLQTEIWERGVRLSWGQKQRLAIAKIMLKNPDIILLDEPTSALDSFNEEQINIALHNLFRGKTVLVVAHRLQTVKQADAILVFENGKIIETGTHDELVALGKNYKRMLDLQSGF